MEVIIKKISDKKEEVKEDKGKKIKQKLEKLIFPVAVIVLILTTLIFSGHISIDIY